MAELEKANVEKQPKKVSKKPKAEKKAGFLKGVKIEAKKVTWYPKSATLKNTIWVIIALVILAAVIGLVDLGFAKILGLFA